MPVTPSKDKKEFWKRIRYDATILNLMGFEKAKASELAKHIVIKKATADILKEENRYICIYNVPSRKSKSVNFMDTVIQIDVLVPIGESDSADKVIEQIIDICAHDFKVNNRPVILDALVGDIAAPVGFYCSAVRFYYFSSI